MKKIISTYGLILGALLCVNLFYIIYLFYNSPDFEGNMVAGYAVLLLIFSLVFFGARNFRNNRNDGYITFGKAFKVGFFIALVGSTMYVVVWLFYYYFFVPDFLDKYIPHTLKQAAEGGATEAELAEKTQDMEQFREMYRNPFFIILITYFEVLPVGLVVALISALILKRKPPVVNPAGA